MKIFKYLLPLLYLFLSSSIYSQVSTENLTVKFGGYINYAGFFDSRQNVSLREGHLLMYPSAESLDKNGVDINDKSNFNFLAIQTRLNTKIDGPEAWGAKASAFVEGEFFGTSDGDVNGFRLRHAFITLKWNNTQLLFGQTWHPMFITDAFPQVLSYNTGIPFQPFSRNPQIRFTQSFGNFSLLATLYSERDFASTGPSGTSSSYLRNSGLPGANASIQLKYDSFIIGGSVDYKSLTPRLETTKKVKTDESVNSLVGMGYLKLSSGLFSFIAQGVYGQNATDLMMLGGYAVSKTDPVTDFETYTNIRTYSAWTDLSYGKEVQVGCFVGYTKNLGSEEPITGKYYSRGDNIDNVYRVSPRVQLNSGKVRLGLEVEYTAAGYGKADGYGKVSSSSTVSNTRVLISTFYFF